MILVPLLNPKFANSLAAKPCELRVRGTTDSIDSFSRIATHPGADPVDMSGLL